MGPIQSNRRSVALNDFSLEVTQKMAKALNRTQYYARDKMLNYQRNLLEPLLRHARLEVPFYAKRLDPLFANDDTIRWEAWEDIPPFTRTEAQQAGDTLFARSVPETTGGYSQHQTSGSTGTPLKFRNSNISIWASIAAGQRIFEWHNVDMSGKMALIVDSLQKFPYPGEALGRRWNVANPDAPACQLSLSEPISIQLNWLLENKPDFLITYPSIAVAICELASERGQTVPIHTFIGQGEVFSKESKAYLNKVHDIGTIDRYGASEVGAIAAQCPDSERHHQFSEISFMEVIGFEDDEPLSEGRGRLIITPFYNYAMPLIRYENQDQLEITHAPCPCGRTLPTISRILGRERHVFTYEDGSRSWPFMLKHEYAQYLPSRQLQVFQISRQDIELRFVRDDSNETPVNHEGLQSFLRQRLHPSIRLKIVEKSEIPRAASGKYEEWISLAG